MNGGEFRRSAWRWLGAALWLWAFFMAGSAVYTVQARASRTAWEFELVLPQGGHLKKGDPVYLATPHGYRHAGEVVTASKSADGGRIAIQPAIAEKLNASVRALYWVTPLSAEGAVKALLPRAVRSKIACQIDSDWETKEDALAEVWRPLVTTVALDYLDILGDEIIVAWQRHESELQAIGDRHARVFMTKWPAIQERLNPILQQHLIPLLGELIANAVAEAPKVEMALLVARGKHSEAYEVMLNWLAGYLATLPDADRDRLGNAVRETWQAAKYDQALSALIRSIGQDLAEDDELRATLAQVYREAVAENPRTAEFVRRRILESEPIREQMYVFLELFAPAAQTVLEVSFFDDRGRTRPEVVQLVRSVSLGRRIAWITLENRGPDAPAINPGAKLHAELGDVHR